MSDKKEKKDHLEVDEPIPGQNYVCLSFVSPESLIKEKEGFYVSKFLQSYCKEEKLKFEEVYSKYENFKYKFSKELQRDFDSNNDYQTSIRGVKVRGVYDNKESALNRAKKLSTLDSSFHVFIGQVGYWLPWDPCADNIEDEVFQNTQLNDMMEKYQENNINRDIFYEEQKRDKIKAAREEVIKKKMEEKKMEENKRETVYDLEDAPTDDVPTDDVPTDDTTTDDVPTDDTTTEEVVEKVGRTIDADMKKSLDDVDPWLANKLKQKESSSVDTGLEPGLEPELEEPELEEPEQ